MDLYLCVTCMLTCSVPKEAAQAVHNCIVLMLVCGHPSGVPPARLHTIKTAQHPEFANKLGCQDVDCLYRRHNCLGNRWVVTSSIVLVLVQHLVVLWLAVSMIYVVHVLIMLHYVSCTW